MNTDEIFKGSVKRFDGEIFKKIPNELQKELAKELSETFPNKSFFKLQE